MTDTSQKATARLKALYENLPGCKRLEMGCGMFDDAKSLAIAGILAEAPGLDSKTLMRFLFLRLFGRDFPPHKIQRILKHLEKT